MEYLKCPYHIIVIITVFSVNIQIKQTSLKRSRLYLEMQLIILFHYLFFFS